jgi:hypothetical protein
MLRRMFGARRAEAKGGFVSVTMRSFRTTLCKYKYIGKATKVEIGRACSPNREMSNAYGLLVGNVEGKN